MPAEHPGPGADCAPRLNIAEVDPQGADALVLLQQAAVEARALCPELHDPGAAAPTNPPTPPGGVYLVAYAGDRAVACGALRPLSPGCAEVHRMFVTASARRQGLARVMLLALQSRAAAFGYASLRLQAGDRQRPALALYEACGFKRIAAFGAYVGDPTSVCFEKPVAATRSQAARLPKAN